MPKDTYMPILLMLTIGKLYIFIENKKQMWKMLYYKYNETGQRREITPNGFFFHDDHDHLHVS